MSVRNDVTVDWSTSPRIITVASPSVTISIQDLNDTLRNLEANIAPGLQFSSLCIVTGKNDLGGGVLVGITLLLLNAALAFAARPGPTYTQCTVTGGNLIAQDVNGVRVTSISPTAFTQVVISQSTSAALLTGDVWDELSSAHVTAGTKGKELRDVAALIKVLLAR